MLSDELDRQAAANDEGFLDHAYMPSFMHTKKRDYARSFGVQFNYQNRRSGGMGAPDARLRQAIQAGDQGRAIPAFLTFSPYGEKTPERQKLHRPRS